jgi:hypothetical protein
LAPALGVPASVIEQDPHLWGSQFRLRANRATIGTDANLQAWLAANSANAKISQDDIQHLGTLGTLWQQFCVGRQEQAAASTEGQFGLSQHFGIASPQQQDLLETAKQQLSAVQQQEQSGTLNLVARWAGNLTMQAQQALPEAVTGAGVGAIAGAPVGGIGVIPGAVGGMAMGFTIGIIGYIKLEAEAAQEAQYDGQ